MQDKILLLRDRPASYGSLLPALKESFPQHDAVLITAADIHDGALENASAKMLVLPGITGEASRYPELIGERGLILIDRFTRRGGVLLTICASTYFICRETLYDPPWGPAKSRTSINHLFNGRARGPVAPYGRQPGRDPKFGPTYSDVVVVPVRFKDLAGAWRDAHVCYGNGPALHHTDEDAETLAVFSEIPGTPTAMLRKKTGDGALYLSCVLPEIGYHPVSREHHKGLADVKRVMRDLKPHEPERKELWRTLTARIGQDLALR